MTDVELLAMHRQGSESAFADLVRRHLGWVYGLARRRLRDAHMAEDVAQSVFVILHRKAPNFASDGAMIGWLHKSAWYAAESAARDARRRRMYESQAAALKPLVSEESDLQWHQLAPMLDELVGRLSRPDREAILLRYYRDLSFAEVAAQLGTTPDAARKRVERAIEKLRTLAEGRGQTITAAALPALLAAHVRVVPPPGLVATATVTATAHAGSALAASTGGIVKGAILAMSTTKLLLAAGAVVVVLMVIGGTASVTAWIVDNHAKPDVMVVSQSMPNVQVGPPSVMAIPSNSQAAGLNFPVDVWTPSPFQAIRWPSATPQVEVNGIWYELAAVDGVSVERILRTVITRGNHPLSTYQVRFEIDTLNYVHHLSANATGYTSADLVVKDLATGQTRTLQNVPASRENEQAILQSRNHDARDNGSPKGLLYAAIGDILNNDMEHLAACFDSIHADQRDRLISAAVYPAVCMRIEDEINAQFKHEDIGESDHFFKPYWWLADLNEFDAGDSAKIDLRSIDLGWLPMHKVGDSWKMDAAWISDNGAGMDRLNSLLPNLNEFESSFKAGRFKTAREVQIGIDALAAQFDAAIPKPPLEP
jgi:RNA polymerase sigma factor (sigma-70 family)